jgi:hypothetical protein
MSDFTEKWTTAAAREALKQIVDAVKAEREAFGVWTQTSSVLHGPGGAVTSASLLPANITLMLSPPICLQILLATPLE